MKINEYPCDTCITKAVCVNKSSYDIVRCPLLYPIFYEIASNLSVDRTYNLTIFNILIWIVKNTNTEASVNGTSRDQLSHASSILTLKT